MNVLGIETSCDETAVAVVQSGKNIKHNFIASQIKTHAAFGGVFPEIASRIHLDELIPLIQEAIKGEEVDLIGVTAGPGLIGSLVIGITAANVLAYRWKKPIIGVDHVHAHIYSAMMDTPPLFPSLGVVVSGGHTFLAKMDSITSYEIIGTTIDDAIGEAFDKVASILGYPYPGGPYIEKLAQQGNPHQYRFRPGHVKNNPLDFSFSGIKTNVLYTIKGVGKTKKDPDQILESEKKNIAASFQHAAFSDLLIKVQRATKTFSCRAIYMGGGVTQSRALRKYFVNEPIPVFYPPPGLSLDNGAMIAGLGYHLYKKNGSTQRITPFSRHFK